MESLNDMFGRDTNSGNEELGAAVNNDVDEIVEFALRVIVTVQWGNKSASVSQINFAYFDLGM